MSERQDMEAATVMLLRSIAIVANAKAYPANLLSAIRSVLADLDANLMAGNWQALAADAAWLIDQAKRMENT